MLFLGFRQNFRAVADFQRQARNDWIIMKNNVSGILLPSGEFIFYVDTWADRQLVLTDNLGRVISSGHLKHLKDTWMEPATWESDVLRYSIVNFSGVKG